MKILKLIGKYSLTALLTLAVIIFTGMMSASGLLLIYSSIPLALVFFVLSGGFEGEVFKENILKGLEGLKLLGKAGLKHLIIKELDDEAQYYQENKRKTAETQTEENQFLSDYCLQKNIVASFKNKKLNAAQKAARKRAKARLLYMQQLVTTSVLKIRTKTKHLNTNAAKNPNSADTEKFSNYLSPNFISLINGKCKQNNIEIKMFLARAGFLLSLAAGIGTGFASASQLAAITVQFTFLAALGASALLIWPLAILGAIGYTLLIYNTLKEIIFTDAFKKLWESRRWFLRRNYQAFESNKKSNESILHYAIRLIGGSLLVILAASLAIGATVFTAGTWWYAVKAGARLVPYLSVFAIFISNALTPTVGITQTIFNIKSSLQSVKTILEYKLFSAKAIKNHWHALRHTENWVQILNPFRLLTKLLMLPTKGIMFIVHISAMGTMTNRFADLKPIIPTVVCGASEGFQDFDYFTEDNDIPHVILKIAFSPFIFASAAWQTIFSTQHLNFLASKLNIKARFIAGAEINLSFFTILKQSFGINSKEAYSKLEDNKVSETWKQYEIKQQLDDAFKKEQDRLENIVIKDELVEKKKVIIEEYKNYLLEKINERKTVFTEQNIQQFFQANPTSQTNDFNETNESRAAIINSRRHFRYSDKKTASAKFIDKVNRIINVPALSR